MTKLLEVTDDYQKLIYSCVKYFDFYPDKEDLFQVGMIGLFKAHENYDDQLNAKFTTYAYPYILGEMRKQIREDKAMKVSRNVTTLQYKIEKVRILLSQKLMRDPKPIEIATYLEVPESLVVDSLNATKYIYSIDEPVNVNGESEISLHETIPNQKSPSLDELIALKEALNYLSPLERKLIEMRYFYDFTQSEVAEMLAMSQVQVSRNENKVKMKLKSKLES